ncbi:MAG: biotin--[acetyl-CoA-carboxylase] ligase [Deltaproteobacteria bacterium]|nr:biotin--[acetyl-CoA-carboxylase] ligase [Deltaproteobacteria bacterium]
MTAAISPLFQPVGSHLIRLESCDSTNTRVMEDPAWLETDGLVVRARHQTAGRGRRGRAFVSTPGHQLLMTVVRHPRGPGGEGPAAALAAGLAAALALEDLGFAPELKWPNDVLLGGKKVCGILVERKTGAGGRPRLVIGMGMNVLGTIQDFPEHLRGLVTTLQEQGRAPEQGTPEMEQVFKALLARLGETLDHLEQGVSAILPAWVRRARLVNRQVTWLEDGVPQRGQVLGLDESGFPKVQVSDGTVKTLLSADLEWD